MAVESPIAVGVLSRLSAPELNTAAFLVLMGLSLWIESPVIDLLSTSTTLAKDRASVAALTRFTLGTMLLVTVVHAGVTLTPLYGWITLGLLRLPADVAEQARIGMAVMIPWSACIGWRRFRQGLLIRCGETRAIGFGTAIRMATMALVAGGLALGTSLNSVMIVATGLLASVFAEAIYAHWVSREVIRTHFRHDDPFLEPLTSQKLLKFHVPLTLTTMVTLVGLPVVSAALSQAPNPVITLAAWQIATTLIWLHRTAVFALPEVVITLAKDAQSVQALRRFCLYVGLATSGVMVLSALVGLDRWFFTTVLGAKEAPSELAHLAFVLTIATPLIGAVQSYIRGMLTAHHLTASRLYAIGVSMAVLVGLLVLGVFLRWPGVVNAAVAITASLLAELAVLSHFWKQGAKRSPMLAPAAP